MEEKLSTEDIKGPYKGAYKEEAFKEEDKTETPEEATLEEESTEEEVISFGGSKESEHDFKKRYDDLKKHYDAKLNEWKEEKESLVSQAASEVQQTEPEDADIESFKENYPDVYNIVDAISTKKTEQLHAEINRLTKREEELKAKSAYQELLALHPDFSEIKKSEEFKEWLGKQPPNISDGIAKNNTDVSWAARVIDLYKADSGLNKKRGRPKSQASAAEAVTRTTTRTISTDPNSNKKTWTASEIRALKPSEYEKFEADIDLARLEGRISNA